MEWADSRGIRQLLEFIGGFEKWSILNEDCRQEITKYLDYPSRCRLERCSKQDYQTVQNTPIEIEKLEIEEREVRGEQFVTVRVRFDGGYREELPELKFSQSGEDTVINWDKPSESFYPHKDIGESDNAKKVCNACKCCAIWNKEKIRFPNLVVRSSNYYKEAVKFVEGWMKTPCYRVTGFEVNALNYRFRGSQIEMLSDCKRVTIGVNCMEDVRWWMKRLPEKMDFIGLLNVDHEKSRFVFPSEILTIPQIAQATDVSFRGPTSFTDDDLINCKFETFAFDRTNITADGINKFIKNRLNGTAQNSFKEACMHLGPAVVHVNDIFQGITIQPWSQLSDTEPDYCNFMEKIHDESFRGYLISSVDPSRNISIFQINDAVEFYENHVNNYLDF